jgi:hypothetical protein
MPRYNTVALQSVLDELGNPELGGRQLRSVYAVVSLLLGRQLDEAALSTDASLSRLETRLREDLRPAEGAEAGGLAIAAGRAIVKLTMSLPGEALPKFLMVSGVTKTLTDCIATHSSAEMRAWVINEVAAAAVRCWCILDDRPFLNSGVYESGSEAQRAKQSLWDWIAEFFGSLVTLCEDENDCVAGAAFTALALPLQHYPLCQTALTHEISVLLHGSNSSACSSSSTAGMSHKESFPHQQIGETVLRLALPALPRLLLRQPALQRAQSPPAIRCCALLATAALRAGTSLSGLPAKSKLMERARSRGLSSISAAGDAPQCCVPLQQCCEEWIQHTLVPALQGLHAAETHAAVLALLQLLHTPAMRPLRSVLSVKAVAAVVVVMPALQAAQPHTAASAQPLHAAQQALLAAAVVALRWVPHSAVSSVLPQLVQLVQQCPSADQRLGLLSDMFFVTMVSLPEGGRAAPTSTIEQLLEGDWFDAALQALPASDSAVSSGSSVRATNSGKSSFAQSNALVFREELVAAVTHTCACVVAAGAAAVLSLSAPAWTAITNSSSTSSSTTTSSSKAGAKHTAAAAAAATTTAATATTGYLPAGIGRYSVQLAHYDPAAAAAARWLELEHWLAMAGLALSATGRCVNWVSSSGTAAAAGADGYTRLLVLVLRLASPAVGVQARAHLRWQPGSVLSGDDRLARAALRVARLGELEWKLHQGVPVRRVRLQLLAVMCRYLVSISDGGEPVGLGSPSQRQQVQQEHEDAATDLVSVLDTELRNLDAVAASTNSSAEQHTGTAAAQSRSHTRRPWLVQEHRALVACLVRLALAYEAAAAPVRAALQAEQARAYLRDGLGMTSKGIGPMAETVQQARRALDVVAHVGISAAAVAAKPAALPHQFGALLLSVNGGSPADAAQRQQTALKLAVLTELPLPLIGDSTDETLTSSTISSSSSTTASSIDTVGAISSRLARHFALDAEAQQFSDLHAPQQQGFSQPVAVNGGSEPLLLTACYSLDPSWRVPAQQQQRSSSDSNRSSTRGITLRITAYNTTCSSITDTLTVQLSFGAGVSPACSPQASVTLRDRLLAGAAYTWDVPLAVTADWCDLHIAATITLAQREPDAEFEADGALELLGGDGVSLMAEKSRAAAAAGNAASSTTAADNNDDSNNGSSGSGAVPTPAVMSAGSYTVPAEALLVAGSTAVTRRFAAFQAHCTSLLHRCTLPVRSSSWLTALCQSPYQCAQAMGGPVDPCDGTAVTVASGSIDDIELSDAKEDSVRRRAWVLLPPALNASDYAIVAAWAFETWQGAHMTVQLTAMKQPYTSVAAVGQHDWIGRLEVRCDREQCTAAVAAVAARFVAFVTNDAFELAGADDDVLCSTSAQLPGRVGMQSYKAEAESRARVLPLWRALQQQQHKQPVMQ